MYEDIKIELKPYLGCSKNLIEFFALIGYDEKQLAESPPGKLDDQEDLELSVISEAKSELSNISNYFNIIINQVYPEKPKIIKISKSTKKPLDSNVIFSFCFDNMVGQGKIYYSCYALKFYEIYEDKNNIKYYVPKALLIYSQYPYFTTFYYICSILFEFDEKAYIPIEMLIQIFVNHIPSPISNDIFLVNFQPHIKIPRLTGYPYIDFNLCRIFNLIPIPEFIKIYILTVLEVDLLFFSPDLEKLNMSMFIFYILNYPLTDTNYLWHIKSISKEKLDDGDDVMNTCMRGVNTTFSQKMDFSQFKELFTIIDLEKKKKFINNINKNEESTEIFQLLEYINNIFNNKKVNSVFLARYLSKLKDNLIVLKKAYDHKYEKNNHFFYVEKDILETNRKIQELFYDFLLNILSILYNDFKYEVSSSSITKKKYLNTKFSDEENIFLKHFRSTIKYNTYFDLFISEYKTSDELKLSLIFTDEYVNIKMNDTNNEIEGHIDYFKIMDNYYSLKPGEIRVSYYNLNKEFKLITDPDILSKFKKEKINQLFYFDKNIIENFLIYKKRGFFKSLIEKENKDFNIETNNKMSIPLTIINQLTPSLNSKYYIITSLIYVYSIVFSLFPFNTNIFYLTDILHELKKIIYKRYYLNILIKSINICYEVNKEKAQFPELTLINMKNYCEIIRNFVLDNSILPNEEMILFFRKIKDEANKNNNSIAKKESFFVFKYEKEENYIKDIKRDIIIKEQNHLIFDYQGKRAEYEFLGFYLILLKIFSIYDIYSLNYKYNLEYLDYNVIYEVIVNLAFQSMSYTDKRICSILINMIIALRKWENDLAIFKNMKNERPSNNNDNNI